MHFYQLMLRVRDMEKSTAFYRDFVGLKMLKSMKSDEWEIAFFADKEGATQIELIHMREGVKVEAKGLTICFQTEDVDALHKRAKEEGLNPSDIRNPDPLNRYFYVYDPDGVSIEFKQKV
jgi:lactoylglutathione lyase